MCGIYGYVGHNAVKETLNGIKKLEYRGYDSAGIAFLSHTFKLNDSIKNFKDNVMCFNSGINIIKEKGEINKLKNIINKLNPKSQTAIGHTRWATHGKPDVLNCHPHYSENGNWAVVHNGIIENYLELKQKLKKVNFVSQTDSEVIAQLLSYNFNGDVLKTIQKTCEQLKGSWALAIVNNKQPNKIYVTKNNSPVVVGLSKNCGVVCSDLNSLTNINNCYVLSNNNFAVVEQNKITIFNEKLEQINLKNIKNENLKNADSMGGFKHFMLKEISEIPTAVKNTVSNYNSFEKIKKQLPKTIVKKTKEILIIGCGTAYHAGLVGKKIIEDNLKIKVNVEIASEFRYSNFKPNKNTLVILVSQSGETADTIKACKISKEYGLKTLAITNVKNSSICFEVDYVINTFAGREVAVASTKAYNCQIAIFYLLSAYFKAVKQNMPELVFEEEKKLINIAKIIEQNKINQVCLKVAELIKNEKNIYFIGRGLDYYLALESSLKLKEISYIHCEAYPAGELKHGTISLIDNNTFVFAFVTNNNILEKTINNINEVCSRGGKVITFSQFNVNNKNLYDFIKIPNIEPNYAPLVLIPYFQLISYYTSLLIGNNPDKPRNLAKSVTVE